MENLTPGARRGESSLQSTGIEREGKKNCRMFRGVSFLPPSCRGIESPRFLSLSLFLVLFLSDPTLCLADAVNDKNLELRVNVDWPFLVFLRDLIPFALTAPPRKHESLLAAVAELRATFAAVYLGIVINFLNKKDLCPWRAHFSTKNRFMNKMTVHGFLRAERY